MAGTIVADTLSDGAGNTTAMDNAIYGSAKAWVNFQGGNGNTAGTINASYNVSSITVVATGQYVVNFTNAFIDTNYVAVITTAAGSSAYGFGTSDYSQTTTQFKNLFTLTNGGSTQTNKSVSAVFFR